MARRADKWFHLNISVIGLTLTLLASATLWYEHNPQQMHRVLRALMQLSRNPVQPTENRVSGTPAPPVSNHTTELPTNPAADKPAKPSGPVNASTDVQVTAYGHDVPTATTALVKQLLNQGHVVDTVTRTLKMGTNGTVHIYLAQTATDYKNLLKSLGVSVTDAQRYSQDTGGFTMDRDIVIPMYQNTGTPDLVNTLAHELTHAVLNANVDHLSSWMNEGLAVYNGMLVQKQHQDAVAYGGYARQMAESVIQAADSGNLLPLADDESKVLSGNTSYDLELQDWLAVSWLVHTDGLSSIAVFLGEVKNGRSEAAAFQNVFHISEETLNSTLANLLKDAARQPDDGVNVQLTVDKQFHGDIRVLQHGTNIWHGTDLKPGLNRFSVLADGQLTGTTGVDQAVQDKNPADDITLYIDLNSDTPLVYHQQNVNYCGFAIDYHYGMYGFVNAWVTYDNGKSEYIDTPSLFGVTVNQVTERATNNPVLALLGLAGE
ncbi:hypothetical protein [Alicyclobacillus contaminans]|uniref:hypothetical protein n=1 Tax=Alicyclobacillus contaminans TaxID=392016 RepID=UPI00042134CB|nr:hypothetical protein [Alicyclobacillus contaminans]